MAATFRMTVMFRVVMCSLFDGYQVSIEPDT